MSANVCRILPHAPPEGYQPTFFHNSIKNLDGQLYGACKCKNVEEIENIVKKRAKELVNLYYKKTYYKFISLILGKTRDIPCDNIFDIIIKSLSYVSFADACSSLLVIAAREGYDDILELIMKYLKEEEGKCRLRRHLNCKDENGRSVFINIILREKANTLNAYTKSLAFLNEYNEYFDIDAADNIGNTALHYAAQHDYILDGEEQLDLIFIKTLIGNGASINMMNKEGICVVDRLPTKMLEDFLNKCIKESKDKNDENYALAMDFKFMSSNNETGFIRALQKSKENNHLLFHPVITTFLHIRCQQVNYITLITPFFTFIFGLLVFIYMLVCKKHLMDYGFIDDGEDMKKIGAEFAKLKIKGEMCFEIVITIFALFIIIREIIHFNIHRLIYLQSFRNYTKLLFISLTLYMLHTENYGHQQRLMAWLFVIIPIGYILILERLHERIAIYVHMLKRITIKYAKFMIFFLYPVGAFGISFYFSMKKKDEEQIASEKSISQTMNEKDGSQSELTETEQKTGTRFAQSTWQSILKTLTMSTGEFNTNELSFQPSTGFIFFVFVFFVYLVCMNLLNGTAISDIQYILNDRNKYYIKRQVFCIFRFDDWRQKFIWIRKHNSCVDRILEVFNFEYCFPDKEIKLFHNKDATADQKRYVCCNIKGHRIGIIKSIKSTWRTILFSITKCISWFISCPKNQQDQLDIKCEKGHNIQDQEGEKGHHIQDQECEKGHNIQDQECKHLNLQVCDLGHKYTIPSEYVAHAKRILDDKRKKSVVACSCETTKL